MMRLGKAGLGMRAIGLAGLCALALAPQQARAEMALDVDFSLGEPAPAQPGETPAISASATAFAAEDSQDVAPTEAQWRYDEDLLATLDFETRLSTGDHIRSIRTETIAAFGYMTAINVAKIIRRGNVASPSFANEGWFGLDTRNVGVDKLVHAHNSYVLAELAGARIRRNTGTVRGTALTGALLSSGFMLYSEFFDAFKGGFGYEDLVANSLGAAFSAVRETTPGMEHLDFRMLLMPNRQVYSPTGREHYRQLRYLLAYELAGIKGLENSPLRFVELHAGYYASGFTTREQNRGETPERRPFVGLGLNLNEVLFHRAPRTKAARSVSQMLDYWQPPYTYVHLR